MSKIAKQKDSASWKYLGGVLSKPVWFFLGFAFQRAWSRLLFSDYNILTLPANGGLTLSMSHLFSSLAAVICGIIVALIATRVSALCSLSKTLYCIGTIGASGTGGLLLVSYGMIDSQWFIPLFAIVSACSTWIMIAWYESISTQGVRGAVACFIIATLVGGILKEGVQLLPSEAINVVVILLPIFAALSLKDISEKNVHLTNQRYSVKQLASNTPLLLIAVVGLVSFSVGSITTMNLDQGGSSDAPFIIVLSSLGRTFFVLCAIILAYYFYRRNSAMAFYIAIPCLLLSSILFAIGIPTIAEALRQIMRIGSNLIYYLVVFLLIELIQKRKTPPAFSFGLFWSVQYCGTLFGQVCYLLLPDNHTMIAVIAMAFLVVATLFIFALKGTLFVSKNSTSDKASRLEELTVKFEISPREQEVLALWLGGHNSPFIEKELGISKSTVKTHLTHIYTKTGTQNKEELLQLFETYATKSRL